MQNQMLAVILLTLFPSLPSAAGPLLTGTSEGMGYRVEKMVEQLDIPRGMTFLGPTELLFTEKNGRNLAVHAGSILRLRLDGTVPEDNPFHAGDGLVDEASSAMTPYGAVPPCRVLVFMPAARQSAG